eukprot:jgi/Psemu1/59360/gm1.59360_g
MPTPFDWTPIFGIEFRFTSASNPTAAASLNTAYSEIIDKDELSEFFRMRYKTEFDATAEHAIRTNTDEEPIVLFELTIIHWRFKNKWRPDLFMQAYTGDPPSATASRAQFANLLQRKYTTPKAAPPDAPILVPIKPAEANVNATIPSGATGIVHTNTKTVNSNAVVTPVEALSGPPANFRRTLFNPQSQSMLVFRRLPKPASLPKSPGASSLQPLWSKVSHEGRQMIDFDVVATPSNITARVPFSTRQLQVVCLTKRHRDALKVKLDFKYPTETLPTHSPSMTTLLSHQQTTSHTKIYNSPI